MHALVEDELRFSASIVLSREEVVPRFRIDVPGEAGYQLFVPLPDDTGERKWRLGLVSAFMAWKGASAFVMSTELVEPDAMVSVAVSRDLTCGAMRGIVRKPLALGPVTWLSLDQIGNEIPRLLPPDSASLSAAAVRDLERVFGPQGAFKVERLQ